MAPRPQDTSYFLEYFQPIVVGDVIDAVKREQNKVEAVIRKRAEISSIFARDVCRGILSFRNFNKHAFLNTVIKKCLFIMDEHKAAVALTQKDNNRGKFRLTTLHLAVCTDANF